MDKINKPFLRWAGGKNWLAKDLAAALSGFSFNTYHEPFLGGGSVFFALNPEKAVLSDLNADLICAYVGLRNDPDAVIDQIGKWSVDEDTYYQVRSLSPMNEVMRAARFIYLNRTSYNGIYRVNRRGEYNVPYGHNDGYKFDYERLMAASVASKNAAFKVQGFDESIDDVCEGDLVFLDPPYTVSHNKNGFIEYNKTLFSLEDQNRLKSFIDEVHAKGAHYILTNAAHEAILEIFKDETNDCLTVSRHCGLGGKNAKRGAIEEYIFTNIVDLADWTTDGR